MKIVVLQNLKKRFQQIEPFWMEWQYNSQNGLTGLDIQLINKYRENEFTISKEQFTEFLKNIRVLDEIVKKLDHHFSDFKKWLISKFLVEISLNTNSNALEDYCLIPAPEPLCSSSAIYWRLSGILQTLLITHNCTSLQELSKKNSTSEPANGAAFSIIHDYMRQLNTEKTGAGSFANICLN